jgi:uncharacterized protein YndB with AHSA1/START domain
MRFLGRLVLVLLAAALVIAAAGMLLPRRVTVERSIAIDAPPEQIFSHINSMQAFDKWSPWSGLDPELVQSFSGPGTGIGNRMEWRSDDPRVGTGSQKIVASVPNERVETELDFGEMGTATSWQVLEPVDGETLVTWGLLADMGNSPIGRYMGLMMDRWVGADYERGLVRLKDIVETE